jgi:hypothetical protein
MGTTMAGVPIDAAAVLEIFESAEARKKEHFKFHPCLDTEDKFLLFCVFNLLLLLTAWFLLPDSLA